jgi:rhodanese-related sulfurtransferase
MRWLIGGLVLVLVLVAVGLVAWNGRSLAFRLIQDVTTRKFPATEWLERDELVRWLSDSSRVRPVILDARSPAEYAQSHLRGAARIEPRAPSLRDVGAFPRDTPVVVYCRVGYRSARVASWLRRQGFKTVYDLSGGVFAWGNEGRPLEANGRPATQVHPYSTSWGKLLAPGVRADAPPVADPLSLP